MEAPWSILLAMIDLLTYVSFAFDRNAQFRQADKLGIKPARLAYSWAWTALGNLWAPNITIWALKFQAS